MSYNYPTQGDVLDILFANRNKMYGAYWLRRTYPDRLKKSVGIMVGMVVVFSVGVEWRNRAAKTETIVRSIAPELRGHIVKLTQLPEPVLQHPQVAPALKRPVVPRTNPIVPTITVTPPRLVDDPAPDKLLPSVDHLDNGQVGTSQVKGDPSAASAVAAGSGVPGGNSGSTASGAIDPVEVMPSFPGGEAALKKFFMRYLQTPDELGEGEQVKVMVHFVVGKDGSITAYAVDQSGGLVFDEEVIRVVKKMPKWNPGIQNGRPVAVYFRLPVTFMKAGD